MRNIFKIEAHFSEKDGNMMNRSHPLTITEALRKFASENDLMFHVRHEFLEDIVKESLKNFNQHLQHFENNRCDEPVSDNDLPLVLEQTWRKEYPLGLPKYVPSGYNEPEGYVFEMILDTNGLGQPIKAIFVKKNPDRRKFVCTGTFASGRPFRYSDKAKDMSSFINYVNEIYPDLHIDVVVEV